MPGAERVGDTVDWGEQRATQRQRTFKRGRVTVAGVEVARCTIRDMSLEGARVVIPDPGSLPDTFTLSIGDEGLTRQVEVRSRNSTGMGVRFTRPLEQRDIGAEFLRHTSRETRQIGAEEARAQLLERARAGAERLLLGEDAPALEMPEPGEAPQFVTAESPVGVADDEPEVAIEAGDASPASDEAPEPSLSEPDAENAAPEIPWDDGRGEGELGAVAARVPPLAVRRHLPWLAH